MKSVEGSEFGYYQGNVVFIVRALYGLKSPGPDFRALISKKFHNWGYRPSIYEYDVWMIHPFKPGGFIYYEYVL